MKKKSQKSSQNKVIYTSKRLNNMSVVINAHENCNMKATGGRILLNEKEKQLLFMQNKPRGPRSKELMRTFHSKVSLLPCGDYKITLRFSMDEQNIGDKLGDEFFDVFFALNLDNKSLFYKD
jgi:hypothetical protein